MHGFINLLKPPGFSSHDMVDFLRRELKIKKIGHAGTLDPGAVGVLVIGIGQATRLLEYASDSKKKYRAEVTFGMSTSTYDTFGEVIKVDEVPNVNKDKLLNTLTKFKGECLQVPPMTSAIKHKGKRLYEYARKGITVARKSRKVIIYKIELLEFIEGRLPRALIDITCSKGTYIRSLCKDIGDYLGVSSVMSFLIRTSSGNFTIENSLTPLDISQHIKNNNYEFIYPIDTVLQRIQKITVKKESVKKILNGNIVYSKDVINDFTFNNQEVRLYSPEGKFLALGEIKIKNNLSIEPKKVFKI